MTKIQEVLRELKTLPNGGLAILCGAGISKESGLPLAIPFMENFLKLFKSRRSDTNSILKSDKKNSSNELKIPFELFIETIAETTNLNFLEIFNQGDPSYIHNYIAYLYSINKLNTVVTTNFDLLIERAIDEFGLSRNFDYYVSYKEEEFQKIKYKKKSNYLRNLIKIHGSIEEIDSIRTTLSLIAKKELNHDRRKVIEYLFKDGPHRVVLILGYSCSDIFDIIPNIESLTNSNKIIVLINHEQSRILTRSFKVDNISNTKYFQNYKGWVIAANTKSFLSSLNRKLDLNSSRSSLVDWRFTQKKWVDKNIKPDHAKFIIGKMLHKTTNYDKALKNYTDCLSDKMLSLGNKNISRLLNNIAMIYRDIGKHNEALIFHKSSLRLCRNSSFDNIKAENYNNIGLIYYDQGNFSKALRYYSKSLKIKKCINDKLGEANTLNNIAVIHKHQNNWDIALKFQKRSLFIKRKIGNLQGVSTSLNNIGILYKLKCNYSRSLKYHFESLSIKKNLGFKKGEAVSLNNIGNVYMEKGDFEKALIYQKQSLKLHKANDYKQGIIDAYDSIGEIYTRKKEFKNALKYRKICLKYIRENMMLKDELKILEEINYIEKKFKKMPAPNIKRQEKDKNQPHI